METQQCTRLSLLVHIIMPAGVVEVNVLGSDVLSLNFPDTSVTMSPSFKIYSSYSLVKSGSYHL